ncbi:MAG: hypothetical protein H0X68_07310 [Chloroflexi bacterium]|nr:hypothetical protein [Chloroflexota bacterium]
MNIERVLDMFAGSYDVIVIDSPPVLPVTDALTIAPFVTGVILVARLIASERRSVERAVMLMQRHDVNLLGVVATGDRRIRSVATTYAAGRRAAATAMGSHESRKNSAAAESLAAEPRN